MTSLTETLPILDEAVPALPSKVEAVAREGDAFGQAAVETLASIRRKRQQAEAAVEQVRQALAALHDQAGEEQQALADATQELRQAAEEEADGVDTKADELKGAGDQAVAAFGGLESQLVQGSDRTRAAQEEARAAVGSLAEGARSSQPELEGAADEMVAALHSAEQVIGEGETLVVEGVQTLLEAMSRLLGEAQARLQETQGRLDKIRSLQESSVTEAASDLATGRERLAQEVSRHLDTDLRQALDPELASVFEAVEEMGREVVSLQGETESRREDLEQEVGLVADRLPLLHGGADQVKAAADRVGISWP